MKLSEFVLWAFKLDLSESRAFTLENRCVCAHFERHFQGIDTKDTYRVIIKLSSQDSRIGTTESSGSVLMYYDSFDFDYFYRLIGQERKQYLLDTLVSSVLKLCKLEGWSSEPFETAKQKVIQDQFDNSYEVVRKSNPSRKLVATLLAEHTENEFSLCVVIRDKQNNIIMQKQVLSAVPDEMLFNSQVGRLKWLSNEELTYCAKDKSVIESFQIGSKC